MYRHPTKWLTTLLLGGLFASTALAADLTPELYVQVEVEVRTITNASLQQRLQLERGTEADRLRSAEIARANRESIRMVFADFDTSGPQHVLYGNRNAKAIETWLAANPNWQQQLDALEGEFAALLTGFAREQQ